MLNIRLLATGSALPGLDVTSAMLDARHGFKAGFVREKSGMSTRRFAAADESQSQLAARALHDALANAGLKPDSIDLLLSACGVQEQALPSTACAISAHAGMPAGMPAFDINASCLSFVVALNVAANLIHSGAYRRIAVVSADLPSHGLDWDKPESSLIFGDGAAAAIVEKGSAVQGVRAFLFKTFAEGRRLCEIRGGGSQRNPTVGAADADYLFSMNGKAVLSLASKRMPAFMRELMGEQGIALDSVDVVVPHQASHVGILHITKRLGLDPARVVNIYPTHGNQVAASIPTALHHALSSGRLRAGQRALLLGTAAGFSLGGLVLDL
jgi:3-oxoacyl-[acyl-carrier-protein] synthase-3